MTFFLLEVYKNFNTVVESLLFYRSWSRSRWKKYSEPEPVKNGPSPQHWSHLSCISPVLHPKPGIPPASLLSLIPSFLHPSTPESLQFSRKKSEAKEWNISRFRIPYIEEECAAWTFFLCCRCCLGTMVCCGTAWNFSLCCRCCLGTMLCYGTARASSTSRTPSPAMAPLSTIRGTKIFKFFLENQTSEVKKIIFVGVCPPSAYNKSRKFWLFCRLY